MPALSRNRTAYCASGCRPPARRFCSTAHRTSICLTAEQVANHPFSCCALDPDVLDMTLTAEQVSVRLLANSAIVSFPRLLLDQAFLPWSEKLLRWNSAVGLSGKRESRPTERQSAGCALAHALLDIPRSSYRTRGLVDDKHHGALFRFKVFDRDGERCERCGERSRDDALLAAILLVSRMPALSRLAGDFSMKRVIRIKTRQQARFSMIRQMRLTLNVGLDGRQRVAHADRRDRAIACGSRSSAQSATTCYGEDNGKHGNTEYPSLSG